MMQFSDKQKHGPIFASQFVMRSVPQSFVASLIGLAVALLLGTVSLGAQSIGDSLYIDSQGNVGIGTTKPNYPLNFSNTLGDKISLWGTDTYYGFGVQNSLLQIHSDVVGSDIAFGYGKSGSLTETMRIKGNGNVGIGESKPNYPLNFSSAFGDKISLLGTDTYYGFGVQDSLLEIHTNTVGSNIAFGYGKSGSLTEAMRIKGNGNVGIGTKTPVTKLDIMQNPRLNVEKSPTAVKGLYITGDFGVASDGVEFRHSNQTQGIGFGFNSIYATGSNENQHLNLMPRGKGGYVGVGTTVPEDLLDVKGNVRVRGNLYVYGALNYYWVHGTAGWRNLQQGYGETAKSLMSSAPSDLRLKRDLQSIQSAMGKIRNLRGVTYRWNSEALRYLTKDIESNISAGPGATLEENQKLWQAERDKQYKEFADIQVGVVAQDVEAVLPEAVTTDEAGYKQVKYYNLIPLLIEALKEEDVSSREQAKMITRQQAEIQRLSAANETAQQQLAKFEEMRQKLASIEASVNRFMAGGGRAEEQTELNPASQSSSKDHPSGSE
jgi:endosialidase-like protein